MVKLDALVSGGLSWATAHPVLALLLLSSSYVIGWFIVAFPLRTSRLPFKNLPGPTAKSLLIGHVAELLSTEPNVLHDEWIAQYGPCIRYRGLLGRWRVCLFDPLAMQHFTQHTYDFPKLPEIQRAMHSIVGQGVLTAEGADHRRQRRVLNPAFGPAGVKTMVNIFYSKAQELAYKLEQLVHAPEGEGEETAPAPTLPVDKVPGTRKVNIMKYLGQMTLDIIGLAGFEYEFDSLHDGHNEFATALSRLFNAEFGSGLRRLVNFGLIPGLRWFPTKFKATVEDGRVNTLRISKQLLEDKKRIVQAEFEAGAKPTTGDLLTRVVRSNVDPALTERMTEPEVLAQIATFILAGHETTSTALTFCLWRLATNPAVQSKLRAEVRAAPQLPSYDELQALPYLDKVVHEALRLDPPVASGTRRAAKDTVFPLSTPVKGRDGTWITEVPVSAGTDIFFPIMNMNRSEEIWGPDAKEFNPDRFGYDGIPAKKVPGVYGNLLTFLGGARNCIGHKFAIAEMKATLFVLLKRLEFIFPPSNPTIKVRNGIVIRPFVAEEEAASFQMPLIVRVLDD